MRKLQSVAASQQFGPYELIQRISVGGMAEVFQAMHRDTSRVVALKRILPNVAEDDEFIALFFDEARIASQLQHDNIAKILDFGRVDSSHYIALEYVDGVPLRTIFDRAASHKEPLPIEVAVQIIAEVARGLGYAHDRVDARGKPLGIVHRDVSPQNVLVSYSGQVKLIDFGIAKAAGKLTRTQAGSIKGKMGYMAPEQVAGKDIDRRSDIFALGICLWEALTLQRLFQAQNEYLVIQQIRSSEIAAPSSVSPLVPPELDRIDLKALAKDPKERYANAQEFEADLRAFARSIQATTDASRIAAFMARMFPAETAQRTSALQHQESPRMSDKAGSDLDVFDGLAKKSASPSVPPQRPAPPPPGAPPGSRQKTLLGLPPPNLPPPPSRASRPGGPFPPPSGPRPPSRPPPSQGRPKSLPPLPPPPASSRQPFPAAPSQKAQPSRPPPPAPLPKPPPAAAAPVDMDWDDDDEKTAIFDKQAANEAPATALLRSAPPPPGPAPPAASARLGGGAAALVSGSGGAAPSMPRPVLGPTQRPTSPQAPTIPASLPVPVAPRSTGRTIALVLIGLLGIGLVVAMVMLAMPSKGSLVVTVAGPGNKPIDSLQVFVDGVQRCQASPCRVPNLKPGTRMVRVIAAGYQQTADRAVSVEKGSEADLNLTLAPESEGTGIKVAAKGSGLRLSVDGKDVGPLPQELNNMKPGDHVINISGSDRYAPFEKHVTVRDNQMLTVKPKLKVIKGLAHIELGDNAKGARVLLVSGNDRRPIPKLPMNLDIATNQPWTIVATKKGYQKFEQKLTFEDGNAEKTFKVDMVKSGAAKIEAHHAVATTHHATHHHEHKQSTAAASGSGTLNINSIPVSHIILDGRPLGTTPKTGIHVSAGTHTVVFVDPQYGRKVRTVRVSSGGTAVAAVKFP